MAENIMARFNHYPFLYLWPLKIKKKRSCISCQLFTISSSDQNYNVNKNHFKEQTHTKQQYNTSRAPDWSRLGDYEHFFAYS